MGRLNLRTAEDGDQEFLFHVFETSSDDLVVLQQLGEPMASQLIGLQFEAQTRQYAVNFPCGRQEIIEFENQPVGRLWLDRGDSGIHIIDIAILPEFRNQGIGTWVMGKVCGEAEKNQVPCSLSVKKNNRAGQFYARLGFEIVGENEIYLEMRRLPPLVENGS